MNILLSLLVGLFCSGFISVQEEEEEEMNKIEVTELPISKTKNSIEENFPSVEFNKNIISVCTIKKDVNAVKK